MRIQENDNELRTRLMKQLIEELPVLRAKGRLTQKDVAESIGISRQTYSGIETGKHDMNWTIFMALIAFFQNNELTRQMIETICGIENDPVIPAATIQLGNGTF